MKQAADSANRPRVLQSTWLRHCRDALTPQAVPSSQALVFSSHVGESHFTWATGNLFTKTSGRLRDREREVHSAEALGDLLLQRGPEEEPRVVFVRAQLVLHRPTVCILLGEQVLEWDQGLAGVRLPGEGLVVGDNARDLCPRTHQVKDVKGHAEPHIAAVEEVEIAIHLLDQGGVDGSEGSWAGRALARDRQWSMAQRRACWASGMEAEVYASMACML